MAEQSLSIKDLIKNLDVAGGGAYKGENKDGFHIFDITDACSCGRWLLIKEIGDHLYEVHYEDECKHKYEEPMTLQEIVDNYVDYGV